MDQVIRVASVSRATLYSNFADKDALLAAVILRESEQIVTGTWGEIAMDVPVGTALREFGLRLLRFISSPETMAFEAVIAEAARARPDYGTRFFAAGPGRARNILSDLIAAGVQRGELEPLEVEQAANDLLGLWQGFWRVEVQYGHRATLTGQECDRMVAHAVEQFLRLHGRARTEDGRH